MQTDKRIITADMLHDLPEPVQRYLTYTGVVGQPWINTVATKGFDQWVENRTNLESQIEYYGWEIEWLEVE